MVTLRNKLTTEAAEKIESIKNEFPTSYEYIQISLNKEYVMELTVEEAERLCMHVDSHLGGLWELFI